MLEFNYVHGTANLRRGGRGAAVRRSLLVGGLWLCACGRFQPYTATPIAAMDEPERFQGRSLDDSGLARLLTVQDAALTDASAWTPRQLALAAVYFHPSLREAAAAVTAAKAAEITAGAPPDVSASAEVSRAARTDEGKSTPWSVTLTTGLTFETGGKRSARIARARAFSLASLLRLEATGWQIGSAAERAAVRAVGADRELADAESERSALAELVGLVRARYAEGRVSLADVAQAEQEARAATVAVAQLARQRTEARLDLSRTLGTPLRAVDSLVLTAGSLRACDGSAGMRFDTVDAVALRARADVGAAIAAYAVAEADLRVEVARQYPDLTIGPGIAWDQGVMRWILSVGTPGIARGLQRGPIAEARARRAVEAARVASLQDSVLIAVDSAVAVCRDASREVLATRALITTTEESLRLARAAYQRGETGRTEVAFAELALLRARRAGHLAAQRALDSAVAVEAASGVWPGDGPRWPDLSTIMAARRDGLP